MRKFLKLIVVLIIIGMSPIHNNVKACTSVLVSGKVSKDGSISRKTKCGLLAKRNAERWCKTKWIFS